MRLLLALWRWRCLTAHSGELQYQASQYMPPVFSYTYIGGTALTEFTPTSVSCNSIVRFCIPVGRALALPFIGLNFDSPEVVWAHVAEVRVYSDNLCTPTPPTTPPPETTTHPPETTTPPPVTTTPPFIYTTVTPVTATSSPDKTTEGKH